MAAWFWCSSTSASARRTRHFMGSGRSLRSARARSAAGDMGAVAQTSSSARCSALYWPAARASPQYSSSAFIRSASGPRACRLSMNSWSAVSASGMRSWRLSTRAMAKRASGYSGEPGDTAPYCSAARRGLRRRSWDCAARIRQWSRSGA
ncbi:hypothetical protein COSO111634_36925 [Corallococcus soli]